MLITGGEPLVRKDFFDIYTYAKRKGMIINLFTNGTLIDKKMADFLEDWQPFSIEITLYGATEKTYEQITGVQGSFKRCVEGIHNLLERKITVHLKTMAMTINRHEFPAMKKFAEDLGLSFRYDPGLFPTLGGSKRPVEFALTPEEIVDLDANDKERLEEWNKFCKKFLGPLPNPDRLYLCGAGQKTAWINPYGQITFALFHVILLMIYLKGLFEKDGTK